MRHDADMNRAVSHCPRCLAEYREGFTKGADCGETLVPGPAPEDRSAKDRSDDEPRSFYDKEDERLYGRTFPAFESDAGSPPAVLAMVSEREAMLLVGRLEAEGIPARPGVIRSQPVPILLGIPEQIEVLVHADRLGEARVVLRRFRQAAGADAAATEDEPSSRPGSDSWAEANERIWGSEPEA